MDRKNPTRRKRNITSIDVARAAGVSQSVVSRAFSFDPSVAHLTREKIFAIADELGYRRNLLARSLITSRSNLFALVTGNLANPIYLSIIESFMRTAQEKGYRVLLFGTPAGQRLDDALRTVLQHRPDGILALAGTPSEGMVEECRRSCVPIVLLGRHRRELSASSVSCDNVAEARIVARLLLDRGHRRFAFIASRDWTMSFSIDRERGFVEAVEAAGCESPIIENGDSSYVGGYGAGLRLLVRRQRPDAVFCANDAMALGLLDAARHELKLAVPNDLSVVGFDDVPMASWASYRLSTIRQRVDAMVEAATAILLETGMLDDPIPVSRFMPGDLIIRESTRSLQGPVIPL